MTEVQLVEKQQEIDRLQERVNSLEAYRKELCNQTHEIRITKEKLVRQIELLNGILEKTEERKNNLDERYNRLAKYSEIEEYVRHREKELRRIIKKELENNFVDAHKVEMKKIDELKQKIESLKKQENKLIYGVKNPTKFLSADIIEKNKNQFFRYPASTLQTLTKYDLIDLNIAREIFIQNKLNTTEGNQRELH
jgi:chromosome segregation ATPase